MNNFMTTLKYCRLALMLRGKKFIDVMTNQQTFTQYLADGGNPDVQINGELALQGLGWDLEKVQMLLTAGANPNLKNKEGVGCIEYMINFCEIEIKKLEVYDYLQEELDEIRQHGARAVEMLLEYGANPEALTKTQRSFDTNLVTASAYSQNHYITSALVRAGGVADSSILSWALMGEFEGLCVALAQKLELNTVKEMFSRNKDRAAFIEEKLLPIITKRELEMSVGIVNHKKAVNKL